MNQSIASSAWSIIASIGWYVLGIAIVLAYSFPHLREKYSRWKLRRNEQEYAAKCHKNPDLSRERRSAMESARQKMQEKYREKCLLLERNETEDQGPATRSSNRAPAERNDRASFADKRHKSIRGEYNPLMGDSSRGYRPPKRSCCSKGGCG